MPAATCGREEAALGVAVGGSIALRREVLDAAGGRLGTIVAVWPKQAGLSVYDTPTARAEPVALSLSDFDGNLSLTSSHASTWRPGSSPCLARRGQPRQPDLLPHGDGE